jgi:hypothetical protein
MRDYQDGSLKRMEGAESSIDLYPVPISGKANLSRVSPSAQFRGS